MKEPGGQMEAQHLADLCHRCGKEQLGTKLLSLDSCQKEPHGLDEVKLKFKAKFNDIQ